MILVMGKSVSSISMVLFSTYRTISPILGDLVCDYFLMRDLVRPEDDVHP